MTEGTNPPSSQQTSSHDVHDMGGNIGPADVTDDRDDLRVPQPQVDPTVLAVDSVPDQVRTGSVGQDETTLVQQGEQLRQVDDGTDDSASEREG